MSTAKPESESTPQEQPIRLMKGSVDPDSETRQGIVRIRCGDCAFLKGAAHPSKGMPCQKLGVLAKDHAPACYTPDIKSFRDLSPDALQTLMALAGGLPPRLMRILLGVFRSGAALESKGLRLLQPVVFNVGSRESLSDYYLGYVFGTTPDGQITIVGHRYLLEGRAVCTAILSKESLISLKTFGQIKNKLIQSGRLESLPPRQRTVIAAADYKPPSIDTAPEVLEAFASSKRAQKEAMESARKASRGLKPRAPRKEKGVVSMNAIVDEGDGL